jgi:hypothetical protein
MMMMLFEKVEQAETRRDIELANVQSEEEKLLLEKKFGVDRADALMEIT